MKPTKQMIDIAADAIADSCEQECGDDLCHCERMAEVALTAALKLLPADPFPGVVAPDAT